MYLKIGWDQQGNISNNIWTTPLGRGRKLRRSEDVNLIYVLCPMK